jgi:hypothetical protein
MIITILLLPLGHISFKIVMPQRGQELEFIEEEGGGDRLDGGASAAAASPAPFGHRP